MRIEFSRHAREQMKERRLEKVWVVETVKYPDKVEKEGRNKYYSRKRLNGLTLEVVYVKENYIKIVTVYPIQ